MNDNDSQKSKPATGAARARRCRLKNPEKARLSNLRMSVKMAEKRLRDESYDLNVKESAKLRQRKSRAKKRKELLNKTLSSQNLFISGPGARKSQEGTETTAGAGTLTPQSTSAPGSKQTRQNIVGKKLRKKFLKDKNKTIDDITEEKARLQKQIEKNEDEIFSLQLQVSELEQVVQTKNKKIESLESELGKCDEWFGLHSFFFIRTSKIQLRL